MLAGELYDPLDPELSRNASAAGSMQATIMTPMKTSNRNAGAYWRSF